jgi:hypothetical protein
MGARAMGTRPLDELARTRRGPHYFAADGMDIGAPQAEAPRRGLASIAGRSSGGYEGGFFDDRLHGWLPWVM